MDRRAFLAAAVIAPVTSRVFGAGDVGPWVDKAFAEFETVLGNQMRLKAEKMGVPGYTLGTAYRSGGGVFADVMACTTTPYASLYAYGKVGSRSPVEIGISHDVRYPEGVTDEEKVKLFSELTNRFNQ